MEQATYRKSRPWRGRDVHRHLAVWPALLAVVVIAGCGGASSAGGSATSAPPASSSTTSAPPASSVGNAFRLRALGSPQSIAPKSDIQIGTTGTVAPQADGMIPIELTCRASEPCTGVIQIELPSDTQYQGAADFTLGAQETETIAVPLSSTALGVLAQQGQVPISVVASEDGRRLTSQNLVLSSQ